jgi:hypothetical protein
MGIEVSIDSSAKYPNGGYLVTVKYPDGLLTGKTVIATDTLSDGATLQFTASVSGGTQKVEGVTTIIVDSENSFRIIREIGTKLDIGYVFEPHRVVRQEFPESGPVKETQVLP